MYTPLPSRGPSFCPRFCMPVTIAMYGYHLEWRHAAGLPIHDTYYIAAWVRQMQRSQRDLCYPGICR
jgi:hypothetical protein